MPMYAVLGFKNVLMIMAATAVLVAATLLLFVAPGDPLKAITSAISVSVALVFGFGSWQRFVKWSWVRAGRWIGPCPIGVWEGTLRSNFSRQDRLRQIASNAPGPGQGGPEPDLDSRIESVELMTVPCKLEIFGTLFALRATMTLPEAPDNRSSKTLTMSVYRDEHQVTHLAYVYRQEQAEANGTDERSHLGSAALTFSVDGDALSGHYWTARRWEVALNTAGRLDLRRACLTDW